MGLRVRAPCQVRHMPHPDPLDKKIRKIFAKLREQGYTSLGLGPRGLHARPTPCVKRRRGYHTKNGYRDTMTTKNSKGRGQVDSRLKIADFTENARAQVDEVIPAIGYVPPSRRPKAKHILIVSDKPLVDVKAGIERIAHADPVGFLAALVHGQPVQVHTIGKDGTTRTTWENASLELRASLAKYFADKLIPYMTRTRLNDMQAEKKTEEGGDEMEALLNRAAGANTRKTDGEA